MQISNFWWIFKRIQSEVCVTWNDYAKNLFSEMQTKINDPQLMSTTQTAQEYSESHSTVYMYTILGQGSFIDWNLPVEHFSIFVILYLS